MSLFRPPAAVIQLQAKNDALTMQLADAEEGRERAAKWMIFKELEQGHDLVLISSVLMGCGLTPEEIMSLTAKVTADRV